MSTTEDSLPVYSLEESTGVIVCVLLDTFKALSSYGVSAFTLHDPKLYHFPYMITCTYPLNVNEFGDLMNSLGNVFHLSGVDFISTGLNFKSSHHLGVEISIMFTHHWISVVLHGPSFHPTVVLDPGEKISLLPKNKNPLGISI